ncbi:hypothetical protein D7V86_24525 [bacterium D16-51]|nr:hypothetical protein D7V96_25670 [bacterium D16-59]RKI53899.1 hypothetical protein D7V86_24525 [bacterium D16-51]
MDELQDELLKDLRIELADDLQSDSDVANLSLKIKNAIREVKMRRNYQRDCTREFIEQDMFQFYSVVYNLVVYDWNKIGAEGEQSHSGSGTSRSYVDREKYFAPVIPFATVV